MEHDLVEMQLLHNERPQSEPLAQGSLFAGSEALAFEVAIIQVVLCLKHLGCHL